MRTETRSRQARRRKALLMRRIKWGIAALLSLCLVAVFIIAVSRPGENAPVEQISTPMPSVAPEITEPPTETATEEPIQVEVTEEPAPTPEPTPEITQEPETEVIPTPTANTATAKAVKLKYPYFIVVDRGAQVVTIYTVGETGAYDIIARQMICSTDKQNKKPTNGVYKLNGQRKRWLSTLAGSYAQYATRISGTILFHSIPYTKRKANKLDTSEYNKLGKNASIGCVRLTCEDAKWIYENVPKGTLVMFKKGEYDAELIESLKPPELVSGKWDPTDDNENNPDYIGGSYHTEPVATPYPGVTPTPTKYKIRTWPSK